MNCTSKGCSGTIVREQVDFFARFVRRKLPSVVSTLVLISNAGVVLDLLAAYERPNSTSLPDLFRYILPGL